MTQINVSLLSTDPKADPQQFQVEVVSEDNSKTAHRVTLHQDLYVRITGGLKSAEELVKASFEFLLEREPKESILPAFDLAEIQKYFPEFEQAIALQITK